MSSSHSLVSSDKTTYDVDDDVLAQSLLEGVLGSKYQCDPIPDGTGDSEAVEARPVKLWRVLTDREDGQIKSGVAAQSPGETTTLTPAWLQAMCTGIEGGKLVLPGVDAMNHPNQDGLIEVKLDNEMAASTAAWLQSMLTQLSH